MGIMGDYVMIMFLETPGSYVIAYHYNHFLGRYLQCIPQLWAPIVPPIVSKDLSPPRLSTMALDKNEL